MITNLVKWRAAGLMVAIAFLTPIHPAHALTRHWKNTGTDFNTAGNWLEGFVPGSSDIADFDTAVAFNPDLSASLTLQQLFFDTVSGYTLTNSNAAALTLTLDGSNESTSAIESTNVTGTNRITAPIILGAGAGLTQSISQKTGGTLIVAGTLRNTNAITLRLADGGTIRLTADNSATLSAPVNLVGPTTLQIGNNNALGTGQFAVLGTGAIVQSDSAIARVLPNSILNSANTSIFGGAGTGDLTFGAMTEDAGQTIVVDSITLTVASLGSTTVATRNLTKEGSGALLVLGNRTEGGTTKITEGTFGVAGTFSSQDINLNGGVLALNNNSVGGSFTRPLGTSNTDVRWTNTGGGFAAYGPSNTWGDAANNLTVNIGGAGATLTWNTTSNFLDDGEILILGSPVSNGTVDFQNGLNFGAANQTIRTDRGATAPTAGVDAIISGVIGSSGGGFTKTGAGTLDLTANNTYTGTTTVNAGTLLVDGNQSAATGAVTVNAGATLGGTGIIGGNVTVNAGGTLAPGHSTGILTTASLTLNSSSNFVLELNNTVPGAGYDRVIVNGTVSLNLGNIVLSIGGSLNLGDKFYVILNDGSDAVAGTFTQGSTVSSGPYTFTINYADNGDAGSTGNDVSLTVSAVPEPETWALMIVGFGAMLIVARKRLRRATLIMALALAAITSARATQISWANSASDFNANGSWVGGTAPGSSDIATFDTAKVFDPNLTASLTIQGLFFDSVAGYTLTGDPGTALTLNQNGSGDTASTSAVRGNNNTGTNTINANLILAGSTGTQQSLSQASGGELIVNGTLTASTISALRLGGGGIIELNADNSATLPVQVRLTTGTTLQIGNNNALGTGLLFVQGGSCTIQSNSGIDRVLPNDIFISENITTFGAGGNLTFGAMTQDGDQTLIVDNAITTVSSLGSDTAAARNLTKEGAGALLVTGNRTAGGVTKITGGTFGIAGSFTSQNINLNGGVLALNDAALGGPFTRALGTTTSTVRWTDSGGFAAYGSNPSWGAANNLTVNIGGTGSTLTWGSTSNFLADGQTLILGSTVSNGTVNFQNGLNFGASNQTIQVARAATAPAGGVDATISGVIGSIGGGFAKTGAGTLDLTANNTYTGTTTVNAGILLVDGNQSAATGAVTVNSGATLGGSGIIGGNVTVNAGGTLAPGNSTGILTTGSLSLASSSNFVLELNNTTPGTGYDQVIVNGSVTLSLGDIVVVAGGGLSLGQKFYVVLNDGNDAVNGTFTQGSTVTSGPYTFTINYSDNGDAGSTGNDVSLTVSAVPEPTTFALLASGGVILSAIRRYRRGRI